MDKTAIKTFAINSRKKLIEDVEYKMSLVGISKDRIDEPISSAKGIETFNIGGSTNSIYDEDIDKRKHLVKEVKQKGFENVVEEVAYTWFNRIIAIRFMEINNFLPTKTRVLSSETKGKIEPDIITNAFDINLDYTQEDQELIFKLKDENKLDELFRFLFIKQCNKLNDILPGLFEKTNDYLELLLNISFTNENGVLRQLIDNIPEKDFTNQVEIIGWLYQFYNSELKDETYERLNKNKVKFSKNSIPPATQIFTPDWIVKYMVENSLGKLWVERHDEDLIKNWRYFINEPKQKENISNKLNNLIENYEITALEDIKIIDPCMGSGHILVYVFDVLMQMYKSEGYLERDAAISIVENNLYGLDIDYRAYQLAYFAIMMKARSYNRTIFKTSIVPSLFCIEESNNINEQFVKLLCEDFSDIANDVHYLINAYEDAKLYGSLINIKKINLDNIKNVLNKILDNMQTNFKYAPYYKDINLLVSILNQSVLLSEKYDVAITNPPYMTHRNMDRKLVTYLKTNYPNHMMDFLAAFTKQCFNLTKTYGFSVLVTTHSWMFSSVYTEFRKEILEHNTIYSLLHMGSNVLGIGFQSVVSVFRNVHLPEYMGCYDSIDMEEIKNEVPLKFPAKKGFISNSYKFIKIPTMPISYWIDEEIANIFSDNKTLSTYSDIKAGMVTGNTKKFLRYWFEVDINKSVLHKEFSTDYKWFPYNKGGSYRKWWGNQEYLINWENDGSEIKRLKSCRPGDPNFYFKKSLTWSRIASTLSFRYFPDTFLFDTAGPSIFVKDNYNIEILLGYLNSKTFDYLMRVISPTFPFQAGDLTKIPFKDISNEINQQIVELVKNNIELCESDWDDYEISWNFSYHPFIKFKMDTLSKTFDNWKNHKENQFNQLKTNEIKLNKLFSNIYNLEVDNSINDDEISINKANYQNDVQSFISYAVGCILGRYSLDIKGINFAGGQFNLDENITFSPDDDNIVPILDTEYFEDDIVDRFIEFVKVSFGENNLEENLDFIANSLKNKGKNNREKIRNYFLKDFFNNHLQTYKKCPIYWQFSSGKQNGFNCLIYMHRYEPSLVARIRTDYLHKTQKAIEQRIENNNNIINNSTSKQEVNRATKEKAKLQKQLKETQEYDEVLAHIANQNIEIDLDDGVKVNYSKFQNIEIKKEGSKTKKVNLLKKI